jgi:hypothetical protein
MTRNIHDSFAKEWMKELLDDFGEVEIEREIAGEVRTIDVVFVPNPAQRSARQNKTKEIREVMMGVSLAYEKWFNDTLAEGKQAERRSIALKMLQVGTSPEFVVQVTGYTLDEVKALQQEIDS